MKILNVEKKETDYYVEIETPEGAVLTIQIPHTGFCGFTDKKDYGCYGLNFVFEGHYT